MKQIKPITFRHQYHKLSQPEFTTIRGKAQFKIRKVGDRISVEAPAGDFVAVVKALELRRVRDMSLAFLKADAEFPGCTITKPEQFVNLLNSFRAPAWTKVTLDSELTVIILQKV